MWTVTSWSLTRILHSDGRKVVTGTHGRCQTHRKVSTRQLLTVTPAPRLRCATTELIQIAGDLATAQRMLTNGLGCPNQLLFALAPLSTTELRIVSVMDTFPPDRHDDRPDAVSRRRLLRVAGGAGVAAIVSACSKSVTDSAGGPGPSPTAQASMAGPSVGTVAAPPPRPVATPAPVPSAASAVLLCRDAWGARPARPGGKPHTITRMTLHHTAVMLGDNRNITARLRQHQRYHQDTHGWIDIAYHISVDRNGNMFELRATELAGDTDTNYDTTGHFLVVCEGDFDRETVTEAQLHGAAVVFAWAAQTFGIASNTLAGHRDVAPATSCPGTDLYAHISSGDLKRRIDDLLSAGTVSLQRVCGDEAAATVAGIEAGR